MMNVLITSGGTRVPIDDVRYIGNMSTGRYGAELADEFDAQNDNVVLWAAKDSRIPQNLQTSILFYRDYHEYKKVVDLAKTNQPDMIISAAAVSDYIVDKTDGKIPSSSDELVITLKKADKILPLFKRSSPKSMVVGFKLLVNPSYADIHNAVRKVLNSGADYVVFNDLTHIKKGNSERTVFDKNMNFVRVENAKELVTYLKNEHYTWSNR
jgi:phosphopantothenoylcysteine synthetase/decarboxylase